MPSCTRRHHAAEAFWAGRQKLKRRRSRQPTSGHIFDHTSLAAYRACLAICEASLVVRLPGIQYRYNAQCLCHVLAAWPQVQLDATALHDYLHWSPLLLQLAQLKLQALPGGASRFKGSEGAHFIRVHRIRQDSTHAANRQGRWSSVTSDSCQALLPVLQHLSLHVSRALLRVVVRPTVSSISLVGRMTQDPDEAILAPPPSMKPQ